MSASAANGSPDEPVLVHASSGPAIPSVPGGKTLRLLVDFDGQPDWLKADTFLQVMGATVVPEEAAPKTIPMLAEITGGERIGASSAADAGEEFDVTITTQQIIDAAVAKATAQAKAEMIAWVTQLMQAIAVIVQKGAN